MKPTLSIILTIIVGNLFVRTSCAQSIPYSQYYNTPLLTNPALAATSDYGQLSFHYRRSRVANYEIPSVAFTIPFFGRSNGLRYGGAGATLVSETAGPGGLYKVTSATGTFAYVIHMSRAHHVSAGLQGGVINRKLDISKLTTDSQFSLGAYDPSLPTGETFQSGAVTKPVINGGFCWVLTDSTGQRKASLGIALYNMNRPAFDLAANGAREEITYIVAGELQVFTRDRFSVRPSFRYIHSVTSFANIGAQVRYTLGQDNTHVGLGAWYKTTEAIIVAGQCGIRSYMISASADFSSAANLEANINNAFEISAGWRFGKR